MYCENCGSPLEAGSVYCLNCGKVQGEPDAPPAPAQHTVYSAPAPPAPAPPPQAAAPPPPAAPAPAFPAAAAAPAPGGFFSTPAGKALAVVLALLVAGGVAAAVIFLAKGDGEQAIDQAVVAVWDDYTDLLKKDGRSLEPITYEPRALREDQEAVRGSMKEVDGLKRDLRRAEVSKGGKAKADDLSDALEAYGEYLAMLDKVYGDLAAALEGGTLKDAGVADGITAKLDEAQELAARVKSANDAFLKGNKTVSGKYDDDVLEVAGEMGPGVRSQIASALNAEKQRLEAEKAAAEQAAAEAQAAQAAAEAATAEARARAAARAANSGRDYDFNFMDNANHTHLDMACPRCGAYPVDSVYGNGPEGWGYYCCKCFKLAAR